SLFVCLKNSFPFSFPRKQSFRTILTFPFRFRSEPRVQSNFSVMTYSVPRLYPRNTRSTNHRSYVVPRYRTLSGRRTRQVLVPVEVNGLPDCIMRSTTYTNLKTNLKIYLLNNIGYNRYFSELFILFAFNLFL